MTTTSSTSSIFSFDTSSLLSYYSAQLGAAAARASSSSSSSSSSTTSAASKSNSATASDVTPWSAKSLSQQAHDAEVLAATSFIDTSKVPLSAGSTTDSKTEQDNQKLFAIYSALNNISYLATMSKRDGTTAGQMAGYNKRFQAGIAEVEKYIANTSFNNIALQATSPSASVTSSATVPTATFSYTGANISSGNTVSNALSGLSPSDSFTITIKKSGTSKDVNIDLSKVQGGLTMSNVVSYVNQQLVAAGCSTRFQKVLTAGSDLATTAADKAKQQYAIEVDPGGTEQVSLSSAKTAPSLYVAGTTGITTATSTTSTTPASTTTTSTVADSQGKFVKLNLDDPNNPQTEYSRNTAFANGAATASSTLVDASGNVYVLGSSSGSTGSQINQGTQDAYLTKYDSAGNMVWTQLVGSAGSAQGAAMALNPKGGVTIVGATNAQLTTTSPDSNHNDSFAVQYDANGNQVWTTQLKTYNTNSATAVSVDASGNVYIGGQTTGSIGSGQTAIGKTDGYLAKLDSTGKVVYEKQIGTTAADTVSATALNASGDLFVASVQNGHAYLAKYAGGDATKAATWQMDMGDLQAGGAITGLAVSGDQVYVSGATTNGALNATVAQTSSGGKDAFVFAATDNTGSVPNSVTPDYVSYVGTSGSDTGGAVTVGSDGTVYLAGTTDSTFAGQSRNSAKTTNMFVAALGADGTSKWVRQYGGLDGQSTGTGIAFAATGSSVLDALGLPSGKISGRQTSDLAASTTLRAGDNFQIQIQGDAARDFKITIDKGETLSSLVIKLNGQLGSKGKASVTYTSKGAALKIEAKAGTTMKLVSGSGDFDALARLGISAQTLSNTSATQSSSSSTTQSYSLGLDPNMDISTSSGASLARAKLIAVLGAVQTAYQKSNNIGASTTTTGSTNSSTMSAAATAYANNQNASANLALSLLGTG